METHSVDWKALRELCQKLMMCEHMSELDAFVCADNLVDADLAGVESHGVSRMTNYMKRLRTRVVDPEGIPERFRNIRPACMWMVRMQWEWLWDNIPCAGVLKRRGKQAAVLRRLTILIISGWRLIFHDGG